MKIPSPSGMTLSQKFLEADKLTRELMDHLERGFVPKVQQLHSVTKQGREGQHAAITDVTVRTSADRVLDSANFASRLLTGLEDFLSAIESDFQPRKA